MKKLLYVIILTITTVIVNNLFACDCDSVHNFISTYKKNYHSNDLIRIVKLEDYNHGMIAKIIDKNSNQELKDTVFLWGDNGNSCRIGFTDFYAPGDTLLYLKKVISSTRFIDSIENVDDFVFEECGLNHVKFSNDSVFGYGNHDNTSLPYDSFINQLDAQTGINNVIKTEDILLYPNPVSNKLITIQSISYQKSKLSVYDLSGNLIDKVDFQEVLHYMIDSNLTDRILLFKITVKEYTKIEKVIIN